MRQNPKGKLAQVDFQAVTLKIGVSYVSIENARENLEKETAGYTFAEIRQQTQQNWNEHLSRIEVKGGSETDKSIFYTALKESQLLPFALHFGDSCPTNG